MTGLQKEKLQIGNENEFQTPRFGESGASTPVHLPVQTPDSQFQNKKVSLLLLLPESLRWA